MNIRDLREIYFKNCSWKPIVAAIINYLGSVDIRIAYIDSQLKEIDVSSIAEIEEQFPIINDEINDIKLDIIGLDNATSSNTRRIKDIEDSLDGVDLSQIATNKNDIEELQNDVAAIEGSLEGVDLSQIAKNKTAIEKIHYTNWAYLRGGAISSTAQNLVTPTTSPYQALIPLDISNSKVHSTVDGIKLVHNTDYDCLQFVTAGYIEIIITLKTSTSASQGIRIKKNNHSTANTTGAISSQRITGETIQLHWIGHIEGNSELCFIFYGTSSTARTAKLNDADSYIFARYISFDSDD